MFIALDKYFQKLKWILPIYYILWVIIWAIILVFFVFLIRKYSKENSAKLFWISIFYNEITTPKNIRRKTIKKIKRVKNNHIRIRQINKKIESKDTRIKKYKRIKKGPIKKLNFISKIITGDDYLKKSTKFKINKSKITIGLLLFLLTLILIVLLMYLFALASSIFLSFCATMEIALPLRYDESGHPLLQNSKNIFWINLFSRRTQIDKFCKKKNVRGTRKTKKLY